MKLVRNDLGRVVTLAHPGSAHTDAELGILLEHDQEMAVGGLAALDFKVATRAQSMGDVPDFRKQTVIAVPAAVAVAPVVPQGAQ